MKDVEQLKKILSTYKLSDIRKKDLIDKYIRADYKLQKDMEAYFGFSSKQMTYAPKQLPKPKLKQQNINGTTVNRHPGAIDSGKYGDKAGRFDDRLRPTTEPHHSSDQKIDEEFFTG